MVHLVGDKGGEFNQKLNTKKTHIQNENETQSSWRGVAWIFQTSLVEWAC